MLWMMGDMDFKYLVFETKLGWMAVVGSAENGLRRVIMPQPSLAAARRLAIDGLHKHMVSGAIFADLTQRLERFLNGEEVSFNVKLDLGGVSAFRRDAWLATCSIPYGETRSYGWVAKRTGQPLASRAVGQALAANPLPIVVPCHRVVGSSGELVGFSAGLEMKRWLLEIEARGRQGHSRSQR